ncbi:hypothetical protein [Rubritalea marina]|uniref:hypothetical protein n=1 Tax=Rubritalea marina TaxID=361055 RepID=UPI00196A14D8|nr:hypothetical protein [Rubritalea marina]
MITSLFMVGSQLCADEPDTIKPVGYELSGSSFEGEAVLAWDSHYWSEGRDALDGDSLAMAEFALGWNHLFTGIWYGWSPDSDYDELQLSLGYAGEYEQLEYYFAYTRFQFPFASESDNELGLGLALVDLPLELTVAADAYYSFLAEGSFIELAVEKDIELGEKVAGNIAAFMGVNQGYIPEGHDGANHLALRATVEYDLRDGWAVFGHVTSNWQVGRNEDLDGDALLKDFVHGGVGVRWGF